MPELPEVEAARLLADEHCVSRRIEKAICADDDKVIEGVAPRDLEKELTGKTVKAACRKGKQMWLDFGPESPALLLHFGMTGMLVVQGVDAVKYVNAKSVDPEQWPPKYWKILLHLEGDRKLAFCDSRRFARAKLQRDPLNHEPVSALGFDILLDRPTVEDLAAGLGKRKSAVKSVLLDQSFAAGVGNWVADEVLHTARIHPLERACDLNQDQLKSLQAAFVTVAKTSVEVNADDTKYPQHWLFAHRWKPKSAPAGIRFLTIGGRTTAFEPAVQKLTSKPAAESQPAPEDGDEASTPAVKPSSKGKSKAARSQGRKRAKPAAAEYAANAATGTDDAAEAEAAPKKAKPLRKRGT